MDKQPFGLGDKGDAQHPQVTLSWLGTAPPPRHTLKPAPCCCLPAGHAALPALARCRCQEQR